MTGSDPQKMKTPKLVLFDIDGTLISARHPILSEAFFVTVENTFGVKDDRIYDYSKFEGATSRYICKAILEKHKVPVTEENIQKYFRAMYKYVVENMDESYGKGLFPEVIPFLTKLKENGIYRGVITGNGEDVGWHKLKVVGIDKYFDFGVFGDIPEKQDELAAQVGPKALNVLGFTFKPENIFVIGDTEKDVERAKAIGAKSIGVLTGRNDYLSAMQKAGADLIVSDLSDLEVINFIHNS